MSTVDPSFWRNIVSDPSNGEKATASHLLFHISHDFELTIMNKNITPSTIPSTIFSTPSKRAKRAADEPSFRFKTEQDESQPSTVDTPVQQDFSKSFQGGHLSEILQKAEELQEIADSEAAMHRYMDQAFDVSVSTINQAERTITGLANICENKIIGLANIRKNEKVALRQVLFPHVGWTG